jgi:hypothetical protein
LVIGLGCAGGALLIALIVVVCVCIKKRKNQSEAEDLVYRVNNSESDATNEALI